MGGHAGTPIVERGNSWKSSRTPALKSATKEFNDTRTRPQHTNSFPLDDLFLHRAMRLSPITSFWVLRLLFSSFSPTGRCNHLQISTCSHLKRNVSCRSEQHHISASPCMVPHNSFQGEQHKIDNQNKSSAQLAVFLSSRPGP